MMLPLLIILSSSAGIAAEEAFTVPQPLSPYGALNPSSGAAVIHINGAHEAKRTIYQPSASDSLVKHYPALDLIDIPLTFSGDDEKLNLPSSVLLPSLHHKKTYVPKGQGVAFQPHEPALPAGNYLQKAPIWIPHAPTHSKHKFTIQNLGQSEKIISQFNKGSNGGKPYEIPREVKSSEKDSLENEASKIADRIIKQELNRAKVAKFGKSAGGSYQANESGRRGDAAGASSPVEQSGYSGDPRPQFDWSGTNSNAEEFPNGYDGLSALPMPVPASPNNLLTNRITEDAPAPTVHTQVPPIAPPRTRVHSITPAADVGRHKPCAELPGLQATPDELSTASIPPAASLPPSSPPQSVYLEAPTPRVLEYAISRNVDGSVTGRLDKNGCVPCTDRGSPSSPVEHVPVGPSPSVEGPAPPVVSTNTVPPPAPFVETTTRYVPPSNPLPAAPAPLPYQAPPTPPVATVEVAPAAVAPTVETHTEAPAAPPPTPAVSFLAPAPPPVSEFSAAPPVSASFSSVATEDVSYRGDASPPAPVFTAPVEFGSVSELASGGSYAKGSESVPASPAPSPVAAPHTAAAPTPVTSSAAQEPLPQSPAPSTSPLPYASSVYPIQPATVPSTTSAPPLPPAPSAPDSSYLKGDGIAPKSQGPSPQLVALPPPAQERQSMITLTTSSGEGQPTSAAIYSGGQSGVGSSSGSNTYVETSNTVTVPPPAPLAPAAPSAPEAPAFVQQPGDNSAESSYRNLDEDHVEPEAAHVPLPVPASTYREVESPGVVKTSYVPSSYSGDQESEPVESYSSKSEQESHPPPVPETAYVPPTAPVPRPAPVVSENPAPIDVPKYINASPSHGSNEHPSSITSQKVSYVPETQPSLPGEPEEQQQSTYKAEQSSYSNLEEDHQENPSPATIIEAPNRGSYSEGNRENVKATYRPPKIQVNPSSYNAGARPIQPYAPQPPRPQAVEAYQGFQGPPPPVQQPYLQPPAQLLQPYQAYPQPQPVFQPIQQLYQGTSHIAQTQQGCCGGQLLSSQGSFCVPMNFDPCQSSQPSFRQGCGACSPTCRSACQPAPQSQVCGGGNCCEMRSPACCPSMNSLCCNQVVQSCCQPQQQPCCNAQNQACCPSPLQSCCCNRSPSSGLCRNKRSIGRLLGLCGSSVR